MEAEIEQNQPKASLGQQIKVTFGVVAVFLGLHIGFSLQEYFILPKRVRRPIPLNWEEKFLSRNAWKYFTNNRLETGLVSSGAKFPATTMWDVGSQLAGMTAAKELGLLPAEEYHQWTAQVLATLAEIPLYKDELPNKAYNAKTLMPVNYGSLNKLAEIGFSAIDLGRLVQWLDIIGHRYPQHAKAAKAVTSRWKLERLSKDGDMMGTDARKGKETWNQEGRLGYGQYAAYALTKLGLSLPKALDVKENNLEVDVYGVKVPSDKRRTYHTLVTSDPYILDGIETGFKALPEDYAGRLLQAQQRREWKTGKLTVWSEDNIDRKPWFVYNSIVSDGEPWVTLDSEGNEAYRHRGSSVKAAVGWNMLFRTRYTEKVYKGMRWLADPSRGVFAGYYQETDLPNRSLTLNTNGIVLESILYAKIGKPLEEWARETK